MKRVIFIGANGKEYVLPAVPSSEQIRLMLGGDMELVRVLDRIERGEAIYTVMLVNETGLADSLPRNQRATEIYQRNVRHWFPDAENPFQAARDEWIKQHAPNGATVIDGTPPYALAAGYRDDPWIAGDVILFDGYSSVEEADAAIDQANRKQKGK